MKKDWLENKLKDRLDQFDADLDWQADWELIQARRSDKKRKPRILWFWWLGGLSLFLVTSLMALQFVKADDKIDENLEIQKPVESEKAFALGAENQTSDQAANIKEASLDKAAQMHQENPTATTPLTKDDQEITTPSFIPNKAITLQQNNSSSTNIISKTNKLLNSKTSSEIINQTVSSSTKDLSSKETSKNESTLQSIESQAEAALLRDDDFPIAMITTISQEALLDQQANEDFFVVKPLALQPIKHVIGLSLGYGLFQRNLNAGGNSVDGQPFIENRKNQEKTLDTWEAKLFYKRRINNRFFAEAGLGFQQSTSRFKGQFTEQVLSFQEDQVTHINRFPDNSTEEVIGTIRVKENRMTDARLYQRYKQWNLNLLVGARFPLTKRMSYRLATGLEYSLSASASGRTISPLDDAMPYKDLSNLGYKKSGLLSGLLRAELSQTISPQQEISFGLIGKASLNNVVQNNQYQEKRYHLLARVSYGRRF